MNLILFVTYLTHRIWENVGASLIQKIELLRCFMVRIVVAFVMAVLVT